MKVLLQNLTDLRHSAYRLAYALLKDREEAEDLVQDVLLKLWTLKDETQEIENLRAYLLRMIRNRSLDVIKQNKNSSSTSLKDDVADNVREEGRHVDRFSKAMEEINKLPETQRTMLQLRDVEGLNYSEIAEILEMEEGAVRTNLSRARNKVREAIINHEKG